MRIFKPSYFLFVAAMIHGCGPGLTDYEENIGNTGLRYVDVNTLSKMIVRKESEGGMVQIVGPTIISYKEHRGYIAGVRQVVNHYVCDGPSSAVEILDEYEYFVVDTEFGISIYSEYSEFKKHAEKLAFKSSVINDLELVNHLEDKVIEKSLGECVNPMRLK